MKGLFFAERPLVPCARRKLLNGKANNTRTFFFAEKCVWERRWSGWEPGSCTHVCGTSGKGGVRFCKEKQHRSTESTYPWRKKLPNYGSFMRASSSEMYSHLPPPALIRKKEAALEYGKEKETSWKGFTPTTQITHTSGGLMSIMALNEEQNKKTCRMANKRGCTGWHSSLLSSGKNSGTFLLCAIVNLLVRIGT